MPAFVLNLLGTPVLATSEGQPVTPGLGGKAMALLAYLQLERRPQSREALAGLLWGESPEVEARASLRQAVKHLRDTLGDVLQADRTVDPARRAARMRRDRVPRPARHCAGGGRRLRDPPIPGRLLGPESPAVRRVGRCYPRRAASSVPRRLGPRVARRDGAVALARGRRSRRPLARERSAGRRGRSTRHRGPLPRRPSKRGAESVRRVPGPAAKGSRARAQPGARGARSARRGRPRRARHAAGDHRRVVRQRPDLRGEPRRS